MGFLDTLLGRTKPARANLDRLFALPGAAVTLEASDDLVTSGQAAVCFKPAVGQAFSATEDELRSLLESASSQGASTSATTKLTEETDSYGYRWVVVQADEIDELVTRVHFVNSSLESHGYGPQLLCSVFSFHPAAGTPPGSSQALASRSGGSTYLVYLFKRGTFYPFVPTGGQQRDNEAELRLKAVVGGDLAIESELDRWFPLWELPIH